MKPIKAWSAIELQDAINTSHGPINAALGEVSRLRHLLQDIVDICNTDPVTWRDMKVRDYDKVLAKIDEIAHGYFGD